MSTRGWLVGWLVGWLLEACLADETGRHLAYVPDAGITTEGVKDPIAVTCPPLTHPTRRVERNTRDRGKCQPHTIFLALDT
jgi:hypothetical protein